MRNINFAFILSAVGLFFMFDCELAASGRTSIFRFLKEPRSPRQMALGSVNTFFGSDAFASHQNPAAISLSGDKEISFAGGSRMSGIGGASGGVSGIVYKTKGDNARAAGFNFTYDGSVQSKTVAPLSGDRYDFVAVGEFAAYSLSAGGYYSTSLPRDTSPSDYGFGGGYSPGQTYFGISGRVVIEKLYERSYPGAAFDIALLEEADPTTAFSIGVKNLGANFGSDSYPLPTSGFLTILKKAGIISFAIDAEYDAQGFGDVKTGIELRLNKSFAFRAGFRHPFSEYDTGDFLLSRLSAGFGIAFAKGEMIFDYAWRPMGELGSTHIAALRTKL